MESGALCHRLSLKGGFRGMLTEKFKHSIDDKNRLIIPAKHREQLGSVFMITQSIDNCLQVYSMDEWKKYSDKLNSLPSSKLAKVRRFIYSNASEVTPDSQGRVVISPALREFAGIEKNAMIVGCGNICEIWAEERWNEINSDDNLDEINDLMNEFGL